jgi:SAM-dependent methyltransferase
MSIKSLDLTGLYKACCSARLYSALKKYLKIGFESAFQMPNAALDDYTTAENSLKDTIASYDVDALLCHTYGKEWAYRDYQWKHQFDIFNSLLAPKRMFAGKSTIKVLDVGCGIGKDAERFIKAGYDYTGIDKSRRSIAAAKDFNADLKAKYKIKPKFKVMDSRKLRIQDNSIDGFWANLSLNHLEGTVTNFLDESLMELQRVSKRLGYGFIVIENGMDGQYYSHSQGLMTFYVHSPESFADRLENCFDVLSCVTYPYKDRLPDSMSSGIIQYFVRNKY